MDAEKSDEVPVILLNWNGWEDTLACLRSLCATLKAGNVWLVDNGSATDRTAECYQVFPSLRVLKWAENHGWAAGNNRALQQAASEGYHWAYLLNNDTILDRDFLSPTLEVILQDPQLAAVGSVIGYYDKQWVQFDGDYHDWGTLRLNASQKNQNHPAKQANGAGMLVRLEAMQRDGWFDERFFCYAEETEWCWRMSSRGWRISVATASIVYHRGEASDISANSPYYRNRNLFLVLRYDKSTSALNAKLLLVRAILGVATNFWLSDNRTCYLATLAGLRDGLYSRFGRRKDLPVGLFWLILGAVGVRVVWVGRKLKRNKLRSGNSSETPRSSRNHAW